MDYSVSLSRVVIAICEFGWVSTLQLLITTSTDFGGSQLVLKVSVHSIGFFQSLLFIWFCLPITFTLTVSLHQSSSHGRVMEGDHLRCWLTLWHSSVQTCAWHVGRRCALRERERKVYFGSTCRVHACDVCRLKCIHQLTFLKLQLYLIQSIISNSAVTYNTSFEKRWLRFLKSEKNKMG